MTSFSIHPVAGGGGIKSIQHHLVLLDKVQEIVFPTPAVDPAKIIIIEDALSNKPDVQTMTTFVSDTKLRVRQSNIKAVTTVRIQLVKI